MAMLFARAPCLARICIVLPEHTVDLLLLVQQCGEGA